MKIGIDLTPLLLDPERGTATALRGLLRGLANTEHAHEVVGVAPARLADETAQALEVVAAAGSPPDSPGAARAAVAREIRRLAPDIWFSPWLRSASRGSLRTVCWVHELPEVRLGPVEGRLRAWRHRRALLRERRRGRAFLVPSDAVLRDLEAADARAAARATRVHHAFDPAPWRRAAKVARHAKRIPVAYALAVGTGAGAAGPFKKGMDVLAAAGAVLGESHQVIAWGELPERGFEDLPTTPHLLRTFGLHVAVAGARLLVHPARSEGFGFPVLEGMAADVPVICSDGGALPEVVGDAAVLVPAGDVDALVEAIRGTWQDEARRDALRERGRARVAAFAPERAAEAWLAAMEQHA